MAEMEALRRRRTSMLVPSVQSSTPTTANCSHAPEWETTMASICNSVMVGDGALLAPPATSDRAAAEPGHRNLMSADGNACAQAATADAESNWEEEEYTSGWEHPGMPIVMIPKDLPAEGSSGEQRFEGLAFPCEECSYHFDLYFKPRKRFWRWFKAKVNEIRHVGLFLFVVVPTCVALSLYLGWLQGILLMKQTSWPLALTSGLLMALHTGYWMLVVLRAVRSSWKAYRDWEPRCDSRVIDRLVDRLAGEQVEVERAKAVVHATETGDKLGNAKASPCHEAD